MPPPLFLLFLFPLITLSRPLPNQSKLLINTETDTTNISGLSSLKRYLHRFGYVRDDANFTDEFDSDFKSAITLYQTKLGLNVTGMLDKETLTQISEPRCGVVDDVIGGKGVVSRYAYFTGQPRWVRPSPIWLTYAVSPTDVVSYVSRKDVDDAVRRAFARWAQVIPIKFSRADNYDDADVKIAFYSGDHGDGEPFDGVLGVLAHAFSPESGKLHMDLAERWSVDFNTEDSKVAVDLESVVTHEIGHVLGLGHSSVKTAVMYPSLSPRSKKADLTVDDVEGVQKLYGSNPNFKMSALPESDTSSAGGHSGGGIVFTVMIVMVFIVNFL